ncbi:hypothetical protein FKN04_12680 [Bacillus glycinifermentans]|uniref:hypothetical protein n=1 Tax=Bacillus glycinifermentans TaxID=1664069 RepID=UPI0015822BA1|nr:hypothetical protein [Bacillus glycinifermentans]NUJ17431.1 hypothetical protein [Bacillus glycinifermentans]
MLVNLKKLRTRNKNRLEKGVYQLRGWDQFNFDNYLRDKGIDFYDDLEHLRIKDTNGIYRATFGVCDHFQQVLDLHPVITISPNKFVIGLTKVRRKDQPRKYGWRWCKWGEYIGNHTPQHEYLYDEEGIEEVFVYKIIRIK